MTPVRRQFTERTRRTGLRDTRLIVIATEGACTEKQYFEAIIREFNDSRLHIHLLVRSETESGSSDPEQILTQLDAFRDKYSLQDDDQLWIVCDVDRWGEKKLGEVAMLCNQKRYSFAVSNPCFELWLLLHLVDVAEWDEEKKNTLFEKHGSNKRSTLEKEIIAASASKSYQKSSLNEDDYLPRIELACERAIKLDACPSDRWPQSLGTRVNRLVREMMPAQPMQP